MLLQTGVVSKIHEGMGELINILQGTNDEREVWIGFSHGDLAIFEMENNIVGSRIRAHPGGVTSIIAKTNSMWSGEHYVLNTFNLSLQLKIV